MVNSILVKLMLLINQDPLDIAFVHVQMEKKKMADFAAQIHANRVVEKVFVVYRAIEGIIAHHQIHKFHAVLGNLITYKINHLKMLAKIVQRVNTTLCKDKQAAILANIAQMKDL